jgi:hypothetical protein
LSPGTKYSIGEADRRVIALLPFPGVNVIQCPSSSATTDPIGCACGPTPGSPMIRLKKAAFSRG